MLHARLELECIFQQIRYIVYDDLDKWAARLKTLRNHHGLIGCIIHLPSLDGCHFAENILCNSSGRQIDGCCRHDAMDVDRCIVRQFAFIRRALNKFNDQLAASVRELQGHGLCRLIDTFRFCPQEIRSLVTAQLIANPFGRLIQRNGERLFIDRGQ